MIDLMPKWRLLILFIVAFAATWVIFKPTLRIALGKNIVDNPEARKLQDHPVPILGGVVVFFGIAVGLINAINMIDGIDGLRINKGISA